MDLSGNLMRDWPAVARFGEEFPNLAELNLNNVRLDWESAQKIVPSVPRGPREAGENAAPFANLRVLSLNGSGCGWGRARAVAAATPSLRELSLARCGVRSLGGADASTSGLEGLEGLEALNLEGNCLAEWSEVETLATLPSLALAPGRQPAAARAVPVARRRRRGARSRRCAGCSWRTTRSTSGSPSTPWTTSRASRRCG